MSETAENAGSTPNAGDGGAKTPRTFTQEEVDKMVGAARIKERGKFADYDDLKAKAADADGIRERLDEAERARASAEERANALQADRERAEAVADAAERHGVDAALLAMTSARTAEEVEESAKAIKARLAAIPAYPAVPDGSAPKQRATKEEILAIKGFGERIAAIAKNKDLFD